MQSSLKKQHGFLMFVAVILIVVIGFLGVAISLMFASSANSTTNAAYADKALYLAEAGFEHATHKLFMPSLASRSTCSGLSISNTLGSGAYSVTATGPFSDSTPATLSGDITSSATTIPVTTTSGYQSSGRIMIDRELINYASVNSTNFVGVTRGVDGSAADAHVSGTSVGQYQCNLSSQGGVPSLTAPSQVGNSFGKRSLTDAVQLQDGFAVGLHASGSRMVVARWNNPTEETWNNASTVLSVNFDLNGSSFLSYVDGWAVGEAQGSNLTIYHWDGGAWTRVLPAVAVNADLNGVYCISASDCWAVGQNNSNNPTIERWNGSSWTRVLPSVSVNTTLNSVFCNSSSDCWAVGQPNSSNPLIERWNGSTWTRVLPAVSINVALNSVFCNGSSDCWAVGAANSNTPLIEHWDGSSWTRVTPTSNANAALNSVYCNSASDCWATGDNLSGQVMLIEHWNGSNWSSSTSPTMSSNIDMNGIACHHANDCWAVGAASTIMHWDGSSWTQVTASGSFPNVTLKGVSLVGPRSLPQSAWQETFA
jgi:Tfp pilus assembly protein PilX